MTYLFKQFCKSFTLFFIFTTTVFANVPYYPTDLGKNHIGYTQVVITDHSRNLIGGGSPTAEHPMGRPLLLRIWYPSTSNDGIAANYALNNPIYDGVDFPGIGYPLMTWNLERPSLNGATVGVPIKKGRFPIFLLAHGSGGGELAFAPLAEIMASQGFVAVSVDSTGNDTNNSIAADLYPGIERHSIFGSSDVRANDLKFALNEILHPVTAVSASEQDIGLQEVSANVHHEKIGLYGYSGGGSSAMKMVAGNEPAVTKDERVKAVVFGEGYNMLNPEGLTIPSLFLGASRDEFNQFTNSQPKYLEELAGSDHWARAYPELCNDFHAQLLWYQDHPDDMTNIYYTDYIPKGDIYGHCDPSVFDGVSQDTLTFFGLADDVAASLSRMPLKTLATIEKLAELNQRSVIAFANAMLNKTSKYEKFLVDYDLVTMHKNCAEYRPNPLDLQSGDKIEFTPNGASYTVLFSSGNSLNAFSTLPANNLNLQDDDVVLQALGFDFPLPDGQVLQQVAIGSNGYIDEVASVKYAALSQFDAVSGVVLSNQWSLSPFFADLDPTAGGGIYFEGDNQKAIITYDHVPVYFYAGNGPTNTMQVVMHVDGKIEVIMGDLAGVGPEYIPNEVGLVGVSLGAESISDVDNAVVNFDQLTTPIMSTNRAILEYFTTDGADPILCD